MDSGGNLLFETFDSSFDDSLKLGPSTYEVRGLYVFRANGFPQGFTTQEKIEANFDLNADFTAVPEPSGASTILPAMLAAAALLSARGRRLPH